MFLSPSEVLGKHGPLQNGAELLALYDTMFASVYQVKTIYKKSQLKEI